MTAAAVISTLNWGAQIVGAVIRRHGFVWVPGKTVIGGPGDSASGAFIRGDRRLEMHFRGSLGLVTYQVGSAVVCHEELMRHLGHRADAEYPGFSSEPLDGFRHLAHDLESYGGDFIFGSGSAVAAAKDAAEKRAEVGGLGR